MYTTVLVQDMLWSHTTKVVTRNQNTMYCILHKYDMTSDTSWLIGTFQILSPLNTKCTVYKYQVSYIYLIGNWFYTDKMQIILDSTTHIFHQDETTHIASFDTDPSYSYAKVQKFLWQNEMFLKLAYTPAS